MDSAACNEKQNGKLFAFCNGLQMGGSLALCLEAMVRMWASGAIVYMGGDDSDAITAGTNFGYEGDVLLQMDDGNNSLHVGTGAALHQPLK